jgi:23S rRNA pseudouridine2605 synthase
MSRPLTDAGASGDSGEERVVPMRLQRYLARAGAASRRGSEDLMTAGRVRVNGVVVTELGAKVDPDTDTVEVDGIRVVATAGPAYFALNKPAGVMTTMDDPQGRPTVASLFPPGHPGLFPVGRLDFDTDGLLLLTTDGELGQRLLHPRHHVAKTYMVEIEGRIGESAMRRLRDGVVLDDGTTAPAEARLLKQSDRTSRIELVIREGRKRQVKRMCSAVGHPVQHLRRVAFGPIQLGDLAPGEVRELTQGEIDALRSAAGA